MFRILLLALIVSSCAPKALTYLIPEQVKFDELQTYRLVNTKLERTNLSKEGRDILDVLEAAIKEKMRERGYEESNLGPDLILRYEISTNRQTQTTNNYSPFGPPVSSRTFLESVVILDLQDTRRGKMFWQASYDLKQQTKKQKQEDAVEDAISEIFYSYPYRAGQLEPDETLADWKAGRKKIKARRKAEKKQARKEKRAN